MRFEPRLRPGVLLRRYKRFLADVRLEGGEEIVAHLANTGSMRGCSTPGMPVALSHHPNKGRKLEWSLELVQVDDAWVCVNTALANGIVEEAIVEGRIPSLHAYPVLRREVRYGENSRIDLLLEHPEQARRCYVEVKNVTLREGDAARFPDARTTRGARHLIELKEMVAAGHRAMMFFLVNRGDCRWFEPAADIDPVYAQTLERAAAAGVEVEVWQAEVSPEGVTIRSTLEHRWRT